MAWKPFFSPKKVSDYFCYDFVVTINMCFTYIKLIWMNVNNYRIFNMVSFSSFPQYENKCKYANNYLRFSCFFGEKFFYSLIYLVPNTFFFLNYIFLKEKQLVLGLTGHSSNI